MGIHLINQALLFPYPWPSGRSGLPTRTISRTENVEIAAVFWKLTLFGMSVCSKCYSCSKSHVLIEGTLLAHFHLHYYQSVIFAPGLFHWRACQASLVQDDTECLRILMRAPPFKSLSPVPRHMCPAKNRGDPSDTSRSVLLGRPWPCLCRPSSPPVPYPLFIPRSGGSHGCRRRQSYCGYPAERLGHYSRWWRRHGIAVALEAGGNGRIVTCTTLVRVEMSKTGFCRLLCAGRADMCLVDRRMLEATCLVVVRSPNDEKIAELCVASDYVWSRPHAWSRYRRDFLAFTLHRIDIPPAGCAGIRHLVLHFRYKITCLRFAYLVCSTVSIVGKLLLYRGPNDCCVQRSLFWLSSWATCLSAKRCFCIYYFLIEILVKLHSSCLLGESGVKRTT